MPASPGPRPASGIMSAGAYCSLSGGSLSKLAVWRQHGSSGAGRARRGLRRAAAAGFSRFRPDPAGGHRLSSLPFPHQKTPGETADARGLLESSTADGALQALYYETLPPTNRKETWTWVLPRQCMTRCSRKRRFKDQAIDSLQNWGPRRPGHVHRHTSPHPGDAPPPPGRCQMRQEGQINKMRISPCGR